MSNKLPRIVAGAILALTATLLAPQVSAQNHPALNACLGKEGLAPGAQLESCSAVIHSSSLRAGRAKAQMVRNAA